MVLTTINTDHPVSCTLTMSQKPIVLYSLPTPNGVAVSIFLEELKAVYGVDYECVS